MFTESNTVEQMILDAVAKLGSKPASMVREDAPHYGGESLGDALRPARWTYALHIRAKRLLVCYRGPPVPLRLHSHAN